MSEQFVPELGQYAFGQPYKEFDVPPIVHAVLSAVRRELDRVMWNKHQVEYASPFDNTGAEFKNDTFEAIAYSWAEEEQPYNFKWRDVEISWYKYLGRGMSANQRISPDLAAEMLGECVLSLMEPEDELDSEVLK